MLNYCNLWKSMKVHENQWNKSNIRRHRVEEQCLLMRGCWRKCWKALNTFQTIDNTSKYYEAQFINAGMLVEMLESIENLQNH